MLNFSAERTTLWAMLNFSAERTTFWAMLNLFPWNKLVVLSKNASFCWNVEYVRSCWTPFPKKVLLSAEMLNMLNYFASIWSLLASHRPQTISTYSTFQQKEAHFSDTRSNMIQHIQHFRRKKHISNSIVLLSAEMLNMLNFLRGSSFNSEKGPEL